MEEEDQPSVIEIYPVYQLIVMGVMKKGNTVPRAGLEPKSLAFRASVLRRLPWWHHYTHAHLSMWLFASKVSADYYIIYNNKKTNYYFPLYNIYIYIIYYISSGLHVMEGGSNISIEPVGDTDLLL